MAGRRQALSPPKGESLQRTGKVLPLKEGPGSCVKAQGKRDEGERKAHAGNECERKVESADSREKESWDQVWA